MTKHFGHEEGAWFWGCDACNPVDATFEGGEESFADKMARRSLEALATKDWGSN